MAYQHQVEFGTLDEAQPLMIAAFISASARMGSSDSSFGLNYVKAIGSPNSQVAKSVEKVSARNLQTLSNIPKSYHLISLLHLECSNIRLLVVATVLTSSS
jgi:hypothetical protein